MRMASGTPEYAALDYAIIAVFNVGGGIDVTLPDPPPGRQWVRRIDTARPYAAAKPAKRSTRVRGNSVVVLVLEASQTRR